MAEVRWTVSLDETAVPFQKGNLKTRFVVFNAGPDRVAIHDVSSGDQKLTLDATKFVVVEVQGLELKLPDGFNRGSSGYVRAL